MNAEVPTITPVVSPDARVRGTASSPQTLLGLYEVALLVIILCLLYLDFPLYIHQLNASFSPKYFYYAFFAGVAPLLVLRFRLLISYVISPFSLWALGCITLNIIHLLVALLDGEQSRAHIIGTTIQLAVLAVVLGFACSITRTTSYERVFPFLAVLIPITVIVDFLHPGVFYPPGTVDTVPGRAAATFFNPNRAGEAMLLTFLLAIPVLRPLYRALLLLLVGAGVVLTFSRGTILVWMLLWFYLVLKGGVPKYTFVVPLLALAVLPMLLVSFESYLAGRAEFSASLDDLLSRLDFFRSRVLDDHSALERAQVLEVGLDLFLDHPIFGAGAAVTHVWSLPVSIHNQLVMLAAEYGVFGIALWTSLAVILWKGKYFPEKTFHRAVVTGFVLLSMFTHNMFDFFYWFLTFALVSGQRKA